MKQNLQFIFNYFCLVYVRLQGSYKSCSLATLTIAAPTFSYELRAVQSQQPVESVRGCTAAGHVRQIHHIPRRVASFRKCVDLRQGVARWQQHLGLAQVSLQGVGSLSCCGNAKA